VTQLPDAASQLEPLLRLAVGLVLGAAVGWERELQRMPAGFRTHALVGLGSAIFTVVSAFAFTGPLTDPTRIAAQIVTGIGFLGGGAILHYRGSVRGLTTAASLWAVAAIGMAAGAGLYVVAIGGAILVIVTLDLLDRLESYARRRWNLPSDRGPEAHDEPDGRTEDVP
jgi:putative Mg2+ transporter-C (MgtC) family protein